MKIYKNCEKKEIEKEIVMIFSCDKYEFDDINFQTGNKIE